MKTAKKPRARPSEATPERVQLAAKTSAIAQLVELANVFARASVFGPFEVEMPLIAAVEIENYGVRRKPIPAHCHLSATKIVLGKRDGLIFKFAPVGSIKCDRGEIKEIDMLWDDVVNSLPGLYERMEMVLGADTNAAVKQCDATIKGAIAANPSMHKILSDGFALALEEELRKSHSEALENNPLFGSF